MKQTSAISVLCVGAGFGLLALSGIIRQHLVSVKTSPPISLKSAAAQQASVRALYAKLPIAFEPNQGQTNKQVLFLSHGSGYNLYLTSNEAVLALQSKGKSRTPRSVSGHKTHLTNTIHRTPNTDVVLRLKLLGANAHPQVTGAEQLPGSANYFIGNDPRKWHTDVLNFGRVAYKQVYPGIDMVYYGNQQQLEYDWVVAPGADLHQIRLGVKGAEKATLLANGDLKLHTECGDVIQHAPVVYQEVDGARKTVSGRLVLQEPKSGEKESRIGFEVAAYDHTKPLVIDPVLIYSTYLGGSGGDSGNGIAVDSVGNAYVTGWTVSLDFPTEVPIQPGNNSAPGSNTRNVFVSVLNASGSALLYSTYLGGSGNDEGLAIALDSAHNAYVTGLATSADFPTQNPYQAKNHSNGGSNAFVTKLSSTGTALVYSTYLGGSAAPAQYSSTLVGDAGKGIAVDSYGNAYVAGSAFSSDFPTTANAFQTINYSANSNGFVTKLNSTGTALLYSTFLGGSGNYDSATGIAIDASGNAYITGYTDSRDFPTQNPYQATLLSTAGNTFVTKLNPGGTALLYSTFLGGSGDVGDAGTAIAVDSSGSAYLTGYTSSLDFPTKNPYQATNFADSATYGLGYSVFVTKMNATGNALIYSTYLGGGDNNFGYGIAVDSAGNAYVTGLTYSPNFPVLNSIEMSGDAFITKFNAAGSALLYSSHLGGSESEQDQANAVAVDSYGNAYVTGTADSADFSLQSPLQATRRSTEGNAFVARIGNYNWQTVDVTVGTDSSTRLLWVDTNQTVGIWSVNNSGVASNFSNFGPYSGTTVQAIAAGSDGLTRLLWNKSDGTEALWLLQANNTYSKGFTFGPYTGSTIVDVAVGADNRTRLLWTNADGTVALWSVDNSGTVSNAISFGPYAGWTASHIATGSDGYTRLIWTKNDGTVALWILNPNNTLRSGFNFGPYSGATVVDVAVGADNRARLLWTDRTGNVAVWSINNSGATSNITNFGPYSGWIATKVAAASDGTTRLLWFKGDGTQALWQLNSNNTFMNGFNYGPY